MTGPLDVDRVDELHVRLSYGRALEGPAHDVFLLDVRAPRTDGRFEERPYLDGLEPVLRASDGAWVPVVLHLNRTHRGGTDGSGQAAIMVELATGRTAPVDRATVEAVAAVFRSMLHDADETATAELLDHDQAMLEARLRLARAYPEVDADLLTVSDEEHAPVPGTWSVGLVHAGRARFGVRIGFVDGDPRTTHVRRLRGSEIVDSLGTGGSG